VFRNLPESQEECVLGLSSSLALMEKVSSLHIGQCVADIQVLNDVLSFNRMESGNFTQAKAPFDFHRQMAMCASSHHAQAQAKDLAIITDLDKRIDELGHTLIGDEMRLRQVTWYVVESLCKIGLTGSNLISNSLKFTNTGSITLRTRLIQPDSAAALANGDESPLSQSGILPSADDSNPIGDLEKGRDEDETGQSPQSKRKVKMAIIRIEVQDTGVGLRPADMEEYVNQIPDCERKLTKQDSTVLAIRPN